jgi:hypothetical protein
MTFDRTTALTYSIQGVLALITVSPTIAGFAARVSLAAPFYFLGLIDDHTVAAFANWSLF